MPFSKEEIAARVMNLLVEYKHMFGGNIDFTCEYDDDEVSVVGYVTGDDTIGVGESSIDVSKNGLADEVFRLVVEVE